jgi:hypothetical protein
LNDSFQRDKNRGRENENIIKQSIELGKLKGWKNWKGMKHEITTADEG